MPDTLESLAAAVLAVLDLQRTCFKWKQPADLEASKKAEAALRKRCEAILNPPPAGLFDPRPGGGEP